MYRCEWGVTWNIHYHLYNERNAERINLVKSKKNQIIKYYVKIVECNVDYLGIYSIKITIAIKCGANPAHKTFIVKVWWKY